MQQKYVVTLTSQLSSNPTANTVIQVESHRSIHAMIQFYMIEAHYNMRGEVHHRCSEVADQ